MLVLKILLPVIFVCVIVAGVILVIKTVSKETRPDPVTPKRASELLHEAATVLASLGTGSSLDDIDILTERHRQDVNAWLKRYQKEVK